MAKIVKFGVGFLTILYLLELGWVIYYSFYYDLLAIGGVGIVGGWIIAIGILFNKDKELTEAKVQSGFIQSAIIIGFFRILSVLISANWLLRGSQSIIPNGILFISVLVGITLLGLPCLVLFSYYHDDKIFSDSVKTRLFYLHLILGLIAVVLLFSL